MPRNPYGEALGDRDPLQALAETPGKIRSLIEKMSPQDLARSYAPGKWTAAQLLVHLAQAELALTVRLRMALTEEAYLAQPFDQDRWLARESATPGRTGLGAYLALREMNQALFGALSAADRQKTFLHPEHGALTVEWLLAMMAGHELHHLHHFEQIAAGRQG